jgi:hypothetical protein
MARREVSSRSIGKATSYSVLWCFGEGKVRLQRRLGRAAKRSIRNRGRCQEPSFRQISRSGLTPLGGHVRELLLNITIQVNKPSTKAGQSHSGADGNSASLPWSGRLAESDERVGDVGFFERSDLFGGEFHRHGRQGVVEML